MHTKSRHKRAVPWNTGEDSREDVLDRALGVALRDDSLRAATIEADLTKRGLHDAVMDDGPSVFAAAELEEQRYRTLAGVAKRLQGIDGVEQMVVPWIPLVFALVMGPALFLGGVSGKLARAARFPFAATQWTVSVVVLLAVVVGVLSIWRWRAKRRARVWAATGIVAGQVVLVWSINEERGQSWSWSLVVVVLLMGLAAWVFVVRVLNRPAPMSPRSAQKAAGTAFDEWTEALLHNGALPIVYERVGQVIQPNYSATLTVRDGSALTSSDHVRMHVPTPAGERLRRLIAQTGGGSFAVAGPRGAGKTHLLRALCAGRYREDEKELAGLAVLVAAPVEYTPHDFVIHLFGVTCEAVIAYVRRWDPRAADEAERVRRGQESTRLGRWISGESIQRSTVFPQYSLAYLAAAAQDSLLVLNYVRSHSDERSAKGGFQGFEFVGKRGVSMAGRARTHPELVSRFREFLELTVKTLGAVVADDRRTQRPAGRVVIGIDELDRIGDGEHARRFLNEVKAVFDVAGCHYLVSVSTEAQHDLDLTGIGKRSVFDSAFDEVVRVDYLDFTLARKLLRRYVLGMSSQFHALAYVFSGGLARHLIRTARLIVEQATQHPPIDQVVHGLVDDELDRLCKGTTDALTGFDDRDGAALLRLLGQRPLTEQTADQTVVKVLDQAVLKAFGERILASDVTGSDRVRRLVDMAGAQVCFLATALEIFSSALDQERMQHADFDRLAEARRYLTTNPTAGLGLLHEIRCRWPMDPITLPDRMLTQPSRFSPGPDS